MERRPDLPITGEWPAGAEWAAGETWIESLPLSEPIRKWIETIPNRPVRTFFFDHTEAGEWSFWVQIGDVKTLLTVLATPLQPGDVILITDGSRVHINGRFIFDTATLL